MPKDTETRSSMAAYVQASKDFQPTVQEEDVVAPNAVRQAVSNKLNADKSVLENTADFATEVAYNPLLNIGTAALTGIGAVTGSDTINKMADNASEWERELNTYQLGEDPNQKGATNVNNENGLVQLAQYISPEVEVKAVSGLAKSALKIASEGLENSAKKKTIKSLLQYQKQKTPQYTEAQNKALAVKEYKNQNSMLTKQRSASNVDDSYSVLMEKPSYSFNNSIKEKAGVVSNTLKTDVIGTAGTTQAYDVNAKGKGERSKDLGSRMFKSGMANIIPSVVLSSWGTYKHLNNINEANKYGQKIFDKIKNSEQTRINIPRSVIQKITEETPKDAGVIKASDITDKTFKELRDKQGLYKVDDGSAILVTHKLGAMRVYLNSNNHSMHIKGSDHNIITPDAVTLQLGKKALFEPDVKDISVSGGIGYNSLNTQVITTLSPEALADAAAVSVIHINQLDDETKNYINRNNVYEKDDLVIPDKDTTIEVKKTPAKVVSDTTIEKVKREVDSSKDLEIALRDVTTKDGADYGGYLGDVIKASKTYVQRLFNSLKHIDETAHSSFITSARNILHDIGKNPKKFGDEYKGVISALYNGDKSNPQIKQSVIDAMDRAVSDTLAEIGSKIKTIDNKSFIPEEAVSDIGGTVANKFIENLAAVDKGLEAQGFVNLLKDELNRKGFSSRNVYGIKEIKPIKYKVGNNEIVENGIDMKNNRPSTFKSSSPIKDIVNSSNDFKTANNDLKSKTKLREYSTVHHPKDIPLKPSSGESISDWIKSFKSRLDKESLPINISIVNNKVVLGNDAYSYIAMANTKWYYTNGIKETKKLLDDLSNKNEVEKAKWLELDGISKATTETDLSDVYKNKAALERAQADVKALDDEINAHLEEISNFKNEKQKGMSFAVKKVITGRMQYSGIINPQQGRLSKLLLDNRESKSLSNNVEKQYKSDAIRTVIDEQGWLLKELDENTLKAAGIDDVDKFTIENWDVENDVVLELGNKLLEHANKRTPSTLKESIYLNSLIKGIGEGKLEYLRAEHDGATNMVGLSDMYNKKINPETGIGTSLVKDKNNDIYVRIGRAIEKSGLFPFINFDGKAARDRAKLFSVGGGYGQTPKNIIKSAIEDQLIRDLNNFDGDVSIFDSFLKSFSAKLDKEAPDLNKLYDKILNKIDTAIDLSDIEKDTRILLKSKMVQNRKEFKAVRSSTDIAPANSKMSAKEYYGFIQLLDNAEGLLMKVDNTTKKTASTLDDITNLRNSLTLKNLEIKLKNKDGIKDISLEEVEAASTFMTSNEATMDSIIRNAFGTKYIELKDTTNKIFKIGYETTRLKLETTKVSNNLRKAIFKELGVKGSIRKSIESDMLAMSHDMNINLWELSELLGKKGFDVMTSHTFYDQLPGMENGFGDKILFVHLDSTTLDKTTGMQYKSLSPISNALPYLLHSTDASLIGTGARMLYSKDYKGPKGLNHRWDAVYGANGHELAIHLNKAIAYNMVHENIYSNFGNTLNGLLAMHNDFYTNLGKDKVIIVQRDIAAREVVGSGSTISAEKIDSTMEANKKLFKKRNELNLEIMDRYEKLRTEADKINSNEKLQVEQYSNGADKAGDGFKISKLDSKDYVSNSIISNYKMSGFKKEKLKNVDYEDYNMREMHQFELMSVENSALNEHIKSIENGTDSEYISIGKKVVVSKKSNEHGFWPELVHELVHHVTKNFDSYTGRTEKTAHIFKDIQKQLHDRGYQIAIKNGDKTEALPLDLTEGKIDVESAYGHEVAASILDRLLANEFVYANKKTVATLMNKKDISGEVSPLIMVNAAGKEELLYTLKDLETFLNSTIDKPHSSEINIFATRVMGLVNGSTKVKDYIYNKELPAFETTIKEINKGLKGINEVVNSANNVISKIPVMELFQLNPEKEAIQTALGYKKGVESKLNAFASSILKKLNDEFNTHFSNDSVKYGNTIGKAWVAGVNKLIYENLGNKKYEYFNIQPEDFIGKSYVQIKTKLDSNLIKFYKSIGINSNNPSFVKNAKRIKQYVKNIASGKKTGYTINGLEKLLSDVIKYDNVNYKLLGQKLTSSEILAHDSNRRLLEDILRTSSGYKNNFEHYMNLANMHGSEHSLFGENVEMSFIENGKAAKIIPYDEAKKYHARDIVGKVKDKTGEKWALISFDAPDKTIGGQSSDLINVNVSNMEKGIFEDNGIQFTGQNMMVENSFTDMHIVKQLSRNMYMKKSADITNDLGYRMWHMLVEQNILKTQKEADNINKASGDKQMVALSEDNPIVKATGVRYYYDVRYKHYFEGTRGLNVRKISKSLAGGNKEVASVIEGGVFTLSKSIDVLKRAILVLRPQSYINSFISSMILYAHHATSFGHMRKDISSAKSEIKSFRDKLTRFSEMYIEDTQAAEAYWNKEVKNDPIHKLMESGVLTTIKSDVFSIGTTQQLGAYSAIKRLAGKDYADSFNYLTMAEDTKVGAAMSTAFEMTELLPKIALYKNLVESGMSHQLAVQKLLMAFPTYYNLPHWLVPVDFLSPYSKYFASTPRMMLYGANQHPGRMMAGIVIAHSVVPLSYSLGDNDDKKYDWYKENGFLKVPGIDYAYSVNSLISIYGNPLDNPFGTNLNGSFAPDAFNTLTDWSKYIPTTQIKGR